ncbi:MAG: M48 family metalloprotease, partial [Gammaproteobacteria bacterium]|nr:M48 family metalloprotease [Gammaproteobacteria bacterium]
STLLILLIKKKLIIALIIAVWILLKALWVKFESPEGYELTRKEFPELFKELDGLRKKLKTPPVHQVILTSQMNAAVNQTPRLGLLGWQKNTLILGIQLLLTMSPQEMKSVLAHELGHLSGNHSQFSAWIYRVRLIWHRVMVAFHDSDSIGAKMMRAFFNWYVPKFEAYSFALARSNEYDADAIAAELTSPEVATKALVNVHATAPYVDEKYWQSYYEKADHMEAPDHAPYEGLSKFMVDNPLAQKEQLQRIREAMEVVTEYDDTHPSLKDRVDAIGSDPVIPKAGQITAAQSWLGSQYKKVMADFDQDWLSVNEEDWKNRYQYVSESKAKLEELEQKDVEQLSDE